MRSLRRRATRKAPQCFTCRQGTPILHWWPELEVPGHGLLYNLAMLGEGKDCEWFMLEFPDGDLPLNPPTVRLRARRIAVREEWFADEREKLGDYVRRKAREWLPTP